MEDYSWPCPNGLVPFSHQKETAKFLVSNANAFCFNEQGTGKTASVIWAADWLLSKGLLRRVLVVCPLSIMAAAWQADLFKFAVHRSVNVAYGSASKRKEIIKAGAEFVIINFDGVEIVKKEIMQGGFDLVVIDEGSAYKNYRTDRWRTMRDIKKVVRGMWLLTGTPAAQAPTDAYGLGRLVNPDRVPQFFGQFRDSTMIQVSQYRWVPKSDAKDIVHNALQPAVRFAKRECLDLPPITYLNRDVTMSPQQWAYYKQLKKDQLFSVGSVDVSAVNAAVIINKLLQIACGSVYTDDKQVLDFDARDRMNAVNDVIEEATGKVLVFVPFTNAITALQTFLEKAGQRVEVIDGSVPVHRRNTIVKEFQEKPFPNVLILQPAAAAHGLTLTAADTIVWYAPVTSVETYLQANARIDRPGQFNPMTVVHINGSPVETKLYQALRSNVAFHQEIVNLYKSEITEST